MKHKDLAIMALDIAHTQDSQHGKGADLTIALGIALRAREPAFKLMMADYRPEASLQGGMSLLAIGMHDEVFDLWGNWGWEDISKRPSSTSDGKWTFSRECEIISKDWYDLVGYEEATIEKTEELSRLINRAIQAELESRYLRANASVVPLPAPRPRF